MNWLFMIFIAVSVAVIAEMTTLQSRISTYFKSDEAMSFERKWRLYRKVFENTISNTLEQQFGHVSMNVFNKKMINPLTISRGYYHTDNQVQLIFQNVQLVELPYLYETEVNFPLHSNVLAFETSVSKLIVHASYMLFRNKSEIIYSVTDQDPYTNSPFRFQQVKTTGDLAISITGCSLSGAIVATLSGKTVNLGHRQVLLKDCQYSLEISSPGTGAPPVIADYLPNGEKGLTLESLLLRPLLEELMPKLQATMISEVNTTAVFSNELSKIRYKQDQIFEDTKGYLDNLIRSMNKKSIEKNMGTMNIDDFAITWDDPFPRLPNRKSITLTKMMLMGLDTVYSSHSGGPIRLTENKIIEQLRFSTLEVMGTISGLKSYEFALEINDYAVDVTIDSNLKAKFEVLGWRLMQFSCPNMNLLPAESFIVGYLINELPKHIKSHLNSVYKDASSELIHPSDDDGVYI